LALILSPFVTCVLNGHGVVLRVCDHDHATIGGGGEGHHVPEVGVVGVLLDEGHESVVVT